MPRRIRAGRRRRASNFDPSPDDFLSDQPPRRPDGKPTWFTYEHDAWIEILLEYPPGAVLEIYQTHLAQTACWLSKGMLSRRRTS